MSHIYALCDPRDGQVRYIGKADDIDRRYKAHLHEQNGTHKRRWIRLLLDVGLAPEIVIIEEVADGVSWKERERYWIAKYRADGARLVNMTDGGDDPPDITGIKRSAETLERMRACNIGRKHTPETRQKLSDLKRGKKQPAGFAEKMRAFMTGRKMHSEAHRAALAERNRQHIYSEAERQHLSEVQKALPTDVKAKIGAAVAMSNKKRTGKPHPSSMAPEQRREIQLNLPEETKRRISEAVAASNRRRAELRRGSVL
jgi:group I intron endonuclease